MMKLTCDVCGKDCGDMDEADAKISIRARGIHVDSRHVCRSCFTAAGMDTEPDWIVEAIRALAKAKGTPMYCTFTVPG